MRSTLAIVWLAFVLSGCAGIRNSGYQDTPASAANAAAAATPPRQYVAMAGASDPYEIESSRLALEKSQSSAVQQFARKMTAHHTETTAKLTKAARTAGLSPKPKLTLTLGTSPK